MAEEKSVTIRKADRGVKVTFVGLWTRNDVDGAYRAMVLELPKHLYNLRASGEHLAKGDEHGRTDQEGRRGEGREEGREEGDSSISED